MGPARKYKRYALDTGEVTGRILLNSVFEIIDISSGGIALKVNRILNVDSEYNLKLEDKTGFLYIRGLVVRSSLSEIRNLQNGDVSPIYTAGLRFVKISPEKAGELQAFIGRYKKEARVAVSDRLEACLQIVVSENTVLRCPDSYSVRQISLSSMRIECMQALEIKSKIEMELSLYEDETVMFEGVVVSCGDKYSYGQDQYIVEVEFLDLSEKSRRMLSAYIDHHAAEKARAEAADKTSAKSGHALSEKFIEEVEYLYNWHKSLGHYKLLDIQEHANNETIKRAYYAMARKFHHDMHPGLPDDFKDKMNVIFTCVNTAYVTLSDPQKKAEYDRTLIRKDRPVEV